MIACNYLFLVNNNTEKMNPFIPHNLNFLNTSPLNHSREVTAEPWDRPLDLRTHLRGGAGAISVADDVDEKPLPTITTMTTTTTT